MKTSPKKDEKWRFLSVLSKEKGRRRPRKITEPNELRLGKAQLLYIDLEAAAIERLPIALQWPLDLEKHARVFQPFRHTPKHMLTFPLLFDMFLSTLKRRFPHFSAHHNA